MWRAIVNLGKAAQIRGGKDVHLWATDSLTGAMRGRTMSLEYGGRLSSRTQERNALHCRLVKYSAKADSGLHSRGGSLGSFASDANTFNRV